MTDEFEVTERRAEPGAPTRSRADERRNTKAGMAIAAVGAAVVLIPLVGAGELTTLPAVVGIVFVGAGCLYSEPATFTPIANRIVERIPLPAFLRREP
ncbi:MAG: hypothetical protein OEW52_00115 [Thermoleophilia bacterium]|nr:hypothetical protein [Thermoleophilia bacterium]